ncbi:MAG TPA: hypothetical protein VF185_03995 [Patescibacteria group bacterium]
MTDFIRPEFQELDDVELYYINLGREINVACAQAYKVGDPASISQVASFLQSEDPSVRCLAHKCLVRQVEDQKEKNILDTKRQIDGSIYVYVKGVFPGGKTNFGLQGEETIFVK